MSDLKIISRQQIFDEEIEERGLALYTEMLEKETHHDHQIEKDSSGTYRWVEDPEVRAYIDSVNLNDVVMRLYRKGITKNSEIYRKMYRDMGYSLYGYWEIFHWEVNNEEVDEYVPGEVPENVLALIK